MRDQKKSSSDITPITSFHEDPIDESIWLNVDSAASITGLPSNFSPSLINNTGLTETFCDSPDGEHKNEIFETSLILTKTTKENLRSVQSSVGGGVGCLASMFRVGWKQGDNYY